MVQGMGDDGVLYFPVMTPKKQELIARLSGINSWSRGDERAPHKPLLLLLALGRIQSGGSRMVGFSEIEYKLRGLLRDFGPPRKSYHPEFPFWHLQGDGLWDLPQRDLLRIKKGGRSPVVTSLRENCAEGGLPEPYYRILKSDRDLFASAVRTILEGHFPESMHDDLLTSAGITLSGLTAGAKRDPEFRNNVLVAYNWRCAVCGFTSRLDNMPMGLDAAHVKWHSVNGPSTPDNGVCLCSLHHKALDRGAIGLDDGLRIKVSDLLEENEHTERMFFRFRGKDLVGPRAGCAPVRREYAEWHSRNCFRG